MSREGADKAALVCRPPFITASRIARAVPVLRIRLTACQSDMGGCRSRPKTGELPCAELGIRRAICRRHRPGNHRRWKACCRKMPAGQACGGKWEGLARLRSVAVTPCNVMNMTGDPRDKVGGLRNYASGSGRDCCRAWQGM